MVALTEQTAFNQKLCEGFNRNVLQSGAPNSRQRQEMASRYCGTLLEGWSQNRFRFEDIDMERFTHELKRNDEGFEYAYRKIEDGSAFRNRGLQEETGGAIAASMYGDFINACVRMGTFEMCESPSLAPVLSCFDRVQVDCVNRDDWTMPGEVDIELDCITEDEHTPSYGLGDMVKRTRPEPEEIRFSMKLKRNMVCVDPNGEFRNMLRERGAKVLERRMARAMVKMVFDLYRPGTNPYSMNYDGFLYDNYLCGSGGPWCNLYYNDQDLGCCLFQPIVAVEQLFEDARNPLTGFPMDCPGNMDVIVTSDKMKRYLTELLGPHLKVCGDGAEGSCSVSRELPQTRREGWGEIKSSKWFRHFVREELCKLYGPGSGFDGCDDGEVDEAGIDQMLERTFVVGDFRRAFAWQVRWDTQTVERSGIDTSEYFREDIIYSIRWSEWTGPFTKSPWAVAKVQGLPDCIDLPENCVNPFAA